MIRYKVTDKNGIDVMAGKKGILIERTMYRIGQSIQATTLLLTGKGQDHNGKPFAKYSIRRMYVSRSHMPKPKGGRRKHLRTGRPIKSVAYDGGYLQYRVAHGRSAKPDLQFTGKMLSAFQIVKLSHNYVRLGFVSKQEAAKAMGNITGIRGKSRKKAKGRDFIGIGSRHVAGIEAELEARLDEVCSRDEPRNIRRIG